MTLLVVRGRQCGVCISRPGEGRKHSRRDQGRGPRQRRHDQSSTHWPGSRTTGATGSSISSISGSVE